MILRISRRRRCWPAMLVLILALLTTQSFANEGVLSLKAGSRLCIIGNTLAERMQYFGHFETALHVRFPQHQLIVRNLGFAADEVRFRPRSLDFGSSDQHLTAWQADVILAFFGFNESFGGERGLETFEKELRDFIDHTTSQKYNGKSAPQLVLISPIAHENLANPHIPDGVASNARLERYTEIMARVATNRQVGFVDLFSSTQTLMNDATQPWTFNGVHLTDYGYSQLAPLLDRKLFGPSARNKRDLEIVRAEVNEKNFFFFHRYRAVNGYYIYGGRSRRDNGNPPFTDAYVLENERGKLDDMVALRDQRIWRVARGESVSLEIDDSGTRPLYDVPTNFDQPVAILPPQEAKKHFTIADGYEINLFASEIDFPDLKNPVQLNFDNRGRLWVAAMPDYPMFQPPNKPHDKLIILEDVDGDGRADKSTVFADDLHVPTGFELGDNGVYVAQQPNLIFLRDRDGDDRADERKLLLHGFDSGDSHHSIGAFTWGPGGGLYLHEGTFHHTAVETSRGPVRNAHGGVYRYDPTKDQFDTFIHYNFANPWGHIFDRWGQNFVADASGGANYWGTAFSMKTPSYTGQEDFGPFKFAYQEQMQQFIVKRVRPTAGCEIVASRHFPPQAQGNFLLNNCIGFQGILQHVMKAEESGFVGTEIEPLLFSTDRNFRPTDLQFGPDGALYVVDWFNPLVGHMQHNLRDPNRDHTHGRIWRITYPSRPLLTPPQIDRQPIEHLLELLKSHEDRTRYRTRLELRNHSANAVVTALATWTKGLDPQDPLYEHHLLEALWVHQHHNAVNEELLTQLLNTQDFRARAAATRVLAFWGDQLSDPFAMLRQRANDPHPRVRVEAARACSFFPDAKAAEIALEILKYPQDYYLEYVLRHTMRRLEPYWQPRIVAGKPFADDNPAGVEYILAGVSTPELLNMARSKPVYVALLSRHGVVHKFRHEALRGLAKSNGTDLITELLSAMTRLDQSESEHAGHVLSDLAHMLTKQPPEDFASYRSHIEKLATSARRSVTRQVAYVSLIAADASTDKVWNLALRSVRGLQDLVDSIPLIAKPALRTSLYPRVAPLIHGLPDSLATEVTNNPGTAGRFVRITIPGKNKVLTLAEVEVFSSGKNIAQSGKATQSSTDFGGQARRAIDGNSSGIYNNQGQTHTKGNSRAPWWELDLGREVALEAITIWNRSEENGKYAKRLDGFSVTVFNDERTTVFLQKDNRAPAESVRIELENSSVAKIRRSAMNALTYFPGYEADAFQTLASFFRNNIERPAAIQGLARIHKNKIPREFIKPLVDELVTHIETIPVTERTNASTLDALQLGNSLALHLPSKQAKEIRSKLGSLGVPVILVRPIPHRMQYDRKNIFVEAGKPVEIIFENIDIMPHNLIITAPGALQEVGLAAERMATLPDAFAKHFIPDSSQVLFATQMLQSRQTQRLQISAPTMLGDYPFVCTFPGHWRTMFGTMHVVDNLEDIPLELLEPTESHESPIRQFVRQWMPADLVESLPKASANRSFENGRKLFTEVACIKCHRMNQQGGIIGPDLAGIKAKFAAQKMNRLDLLVEMLEPSKQIADKYRTQIFETDAGLLFSGVVVQEDEEIVRLVSNPLEKKENALEIRKSEIEDRFASKISLMPLGLLNTLTAEDILDLLAYIESAGDAQHPAFQN